MVEAIKMTSIIIDIIITYKNTKIRYIDIFYISKIKFLFFFF